MTISELLSTMAILGLILTVTVNFFSLANGYYFVSAGKINTLSESQIAVRRLTAELQETDAGSVQFSSTHDALVFISARSSSGSFQTSNGAPNWQKWVYYATSTDPNGSYYILIRKESSSIFGGLPSTSDQVPPGNWQTQFQSLNGQSTIAADISTFQVQDCDCDSGSLLHSPYYIQVIATVKYKGQLTNFNPGYLTSAISSCSGISSCTSSGNWVEAQVINP